MLKNFFNSKLFVDIKPDNILLEFTNENNTRLKTIGVIDFGSSFLEHSPRAQSATTPEYTPPEYLQNQTLNCSFDMWSVGTIFLEILCGFPLWLPYKAKMNHELPFQTGLFACSGRHPAKVFQRQQKVLAKEFYDSIQLYHGIGHDLPPTALEFQFLEELLQLDPNDRLTPSEALSHPYLDL